MTLGNIDNANIKLNGLELDDCFDSISGLVNKMKKHYWFSISTSLLRALGSLDIVGNPVGLFSNISSGVKDLIEKPIEGFSKGPLDVGLGVAEGMGSLVKNTLAGTLNSFNKIASSLSSGISLLTFDEEYIKQKQLVQNQKIENLSQGVSQIGNTLFQGFAKGVTGVFVQPFKGAQQQGVKGFLKGTLQGLTGIVVKPVAGILDAVSITTEEIKVLVTSKDDNPNEDRFQYPRVFYGPEKFIKQYNADDAEILNTMQVYKNGKYSKCNFLYSSLIKLHSPNPQQQSQKQFILIIFVEYVILLDKMKRKRVWEISKNNIVQISQTGETIKIELDIPHKISNTNEVLLKLLPKDNNIQEIYSRLNELKEISKYMN